MQSEAGSWPQRGVALPSVRAIGGGRTTRDVCPRGRKTSDPGTRQRGSGRVRAEADFPAREAEAPERGRDRVLDARLKPSRYEATSFGRKPSRGGASSAPTAARGASTA